MAERSANERLFDETVRRKIALLRLERGEARRVEELLQELERDLLDQIGAKLASGATDARLDALLVSVRDLVAAGFTRLTGDSEAMMAELAQIEADWERGTIERVLPVRLEMVAPATEQLVALANAAVQGLSLARWFETIEASLIARLERALRVGVAEGQTVDDLVRRVRGTRKNGFQDGVMEATRRDATAIVRTGVSHASNAARELVWKANADVILCVRWTSVLDGRTTLVCMSRDGHVAPVVEGQSVPDDVKGPRLDPPSARPPAHINCRSVMVAVVSAEGIVGRRPYVLDTRVRGEREADFRRQAREQSTTVQALRAEWARERVGGVPAKTTYEEWFALQPADFQRTVLGPSRYRMYRDGAPLGRFVDNSGRRLTLDELKAQR